MYNSYRGIEYEKNIKKEHRNIKTDKNHYAPPQF